MHALNEITVFQLGIGSACIMRVKALFAHKTYVYPGHWENNNKGEVSRVFGILFPVQSDNGNVACMDRKWQRDVPESGHHLCFTFRVFR